MIVKIEKKSITVKIEKAVTVNNAVWGSIAGTLSNQTDLNTALNSKLSNSMNSNKLLGRGSTGIGAVEEITLGSNLSLDGTTLNASGGSEAVWGSITGTLSDQTDLQTALNNKQDVLSYTPENEDNKKTSLTENSDTYYPSQKAVKTAVDSKADLSHTHVEADITDLKNYSEVGHTHSQSDINDLETDLESLQGKITAVASGSVTKDTLGVLFNSSGLKVRQVSKTTTREFQALAGSTTVTLSEVSAVELGGVIIFFYRAASGYPTVRAYDLSSGISKGSAVTITSNSSTGLSIATNGTNFVISYVRSSQVYAVAGTVSGTTITMGTETAITSRTVTWANSLAWDSNAERYCLLCTDGGSQTYIQTMTVSGTTISLNAAGNVSTVINHSCTPSMIFDDTLNKLIFIGSNAITSHYVRHCTVTAGSPDTFSFSNQVNIESPKQSNNPAPVAKLVRAYNKTYVLINTQNIAQILDRRIKLYEITLSGSNTVSTDQNIDVDTYGIQTGSADYIEAVYDEHLDLSLIHI